MKDMTFVATKADIIDLKKSTKADIQELKEDLSRLIRTSFNALQAEIALTRREMHVRADDVLNELGVFVDMVDDRFNKLEAEVARR